MNLIESELPPLRRRNAGRCTYNGGTLLENRRTNEMK
jgi:hypothetical protein